ncbi:DUF2865 domain-containing protein [Rhizobium sp. ARZ01]|uniref:DUF2865 domain-containing protein n=1 Tax=Rhizobium sp. ARZ01 TaxID=2769313 RepID=UPI00177E0676|nr:DUF2865 domain-containing protein [Rhizobium sp. ARZ01]
MPLRLRRLMVLATAALACTLVVPARASDVCDDLQSRLASLPQVDIPINDAGSHSSPVAQLSAQLEQARADLRQLGCSTGSVTVFRTSSARECSEIASAIERMERNIKGLFARQGELASLGSYQEARVQILAEIELNGCRGVGSSDPDEAYDRATADGLPDDGLATRYGGSGTPGGRLRTVCVRTCDGGFFPMTQGASPLDFRRDQRACARMCPQTETELYYQSLNSLDSGEMVSTVTGRLYAQLPTAFAYRTPDFSKPRDCGCDLSAYHRSMRNNSTRTGAGDSAQGAIKENVGSVTTIRMRPVGQAKTADKVVIERPYDPVKDKVRNVGPVFLPDPEGAIDLRNPAGPK